MFFTMPALSDKTTEIGLAGSKEPFVLVINVTDPEKMKFD